MKSAIALWKHLACSAFGLLLLFSFPVFADTRIAVLDFDLNDLTLLPRTPEELERTASVAPLLRAALAKKGGYELVTIDPEMQAKANVSFGYLFEHLDVAADLGRRFEVDWIAVGRVHKPSFLFVYLKVHLVNVKTQRLAGDYVVEVKGYLKKLTERGAASLAEQIDQTIESWGLQTFHLIYRKILPIMEAYEAFRMGKTSRCLISYSLELVQGGRIACQGRTDRYWYDPG